MIKEWLEARKQAKKLQDELHKKFWSQPFAARADWFFENAYGQKDIMYRNLGLGLGYAILALTDAVELLDKKKNPCAEGE